MTKSLTGRPDLQSQSASGTGGGPQRTCVGCRQVAPQQDLIRFVCRDGQVMVDRGRLLPGRGAYLHDQEACLQQALKRGGFARSFSARVDTSSLAAALNVRLGDPAPSR